MLKREYLQQHKTLSFLEDKPLFAVQDFVPITDNEIMATLGQRGGRVGQVKGWDEILHYIRKYVHPALLDLNICLRLDALWF